MFDEEQYKTRSRELLTKFIDDSGRQTDSFTCGQDRNLMPGYFDSHSKRFLDGIRFIEKYVPKTENIDCAEFGSPFPFYLLYFSEAFKWMVTCIDISNKRNTVITDKMISIFGNLVTDDLGKDKYDLVTACEIWEHVPTSLIALKEKIIRSIKPGGFLMASYPLGGKNNYDMWDKTMDENIYIHHDHMREFNEETSLSFITELSIVDKCISNPWTNLGNYSILYKKALT